MRVLLLVISLVVVPVVPARAQVLDPAKPHIRIYLGAEPPALAFYDSPALSGEPVFRLDARGLKIDGRLVCSWPGGQYRYDRSAPMMVLGYAERDGNWEAVNGGCPAGVPIISGWDFGGATLYVAVEKLDGLIVSVRYESRFAYFTLESLHGRPREGSGDFLKQLSRTGRIGWEWLPSEEEVRRQHAAVFAQLQQLPAFSRFLASIRNCLDSDDVVRCIPAVADPNIQHDGEGGTGLVSFLQYLSQASVTTPGETVASELRRCFGSGGRFRDGGAPRYVQFVTESGYICEVHRVESRYLLVGLWPNPD